MPNTSKSQNLNPHEFGVRKGVLVEKVPTEKMGHLVMLWIHLAHWTRLRVFRGRGNRSAEAIGPQTPNHLHRLALQEALFLCPHHTRPCWNCSNQPVLSLLALSCFALLAEATVEAPACSLPFFLLPPDGAWSFPAQACVTWPVPSSWELWVTISAFQ